ncbi:hypothetical protein MMC10_008902 [Thelotrema lepadinum]|nr:hypothetical protein [Thelotrema lepadinum]
MDAIFNSVTALAKGADESMRKQIINGLRDLSYSIETPDDTVTRIWSGHLISATVRTAINLKLFNHLADSQTPLDLPKLSDLTKANPVLLGRLCRCLAAHAMIKETALDEYAATNITRALATPGNQGCIKH